MHALALAENSIPSRERAELAVVYAETVCAYARVLCPVVVRLPEGSSAWPNIIDHLVERLRQARAGEITLDLTEIAAQLHGRLQSVAAPLF